MKTIHLDAVGGVAGDMFVAAMLDAFPDLHARVMADVAAVLPADAGTAFLEEGESGGIRVLRFGLRGEADRHRRGHGKGHAHSHDHHHQQDELIVQPRAEHDHASGSYRDLVHRIGAAPLHPGTPDHAVAVLTLLAKAEAGIHQVPVEDVHFHEIADWDSLADVVAAGSIAAALDSATWTVSALPLGGGLVKTAHGLLPVPAPATVAILDGFEWRDDGIAGERVTPTGAAILRHLARPAVAPSGGRLLASGTGAGTRSLPGMPNVLRALVFEISERPQQDTVVSIVFEADDMTGEEIGVAAERLRALPGVLDLSIGQRWGKKGRPMQSFALLVRPQDADYVAERCFAETSTIGLRLAEERRLVLPRQSASVDGVRTKSVRRGGEITVKAESDDIAGDTLAERRRAKRKAESDD